MTDSLPESNEVSQKSEDVKTLEVAAYPLAGATVKSTLRLYPPKTERDTSSLWAKQRWASSALCSQPVISASPERGRG